MSPVFIVLVIVALGFGALALIQVRVRKENPPSRASTLGLATIGMFFMIGAGAVLFFSARG